MSFKPSRRDVPFTGVVILVHVIFFLLALTYKRIYMGDSFEYIYEALNIKQYHFFYSGNPAMPIEPEYMTQRQPLYPLFLLGVYLFSINNWIVLILQNILSVFNICYVRKTLFHIGYNAKFDWLLLLLLVAYPAQFINVNTIAPDILLQTFTVLYFGGYINFIRDRQFSQLVWMSITLICGLFVKPVLYPFVVLHIVILVVTASVLKLRLQRPIAVAIIPLCAVLLYNYWNYTRTDKFHFSSNQAFNASYYFYPFISSKYGADSADKFLAKARAEYAAIPEYKDRYDHANEQGWNMLKDNFGPYLIFHLKNAVRIFIEPGKGEMDLFTGRLTYGRLYGREQTGFYATLHKSGWGGMGTYIRNNPSLPLVLVVLIFNCIRLAGFLWFLFRRKISWLIRTFVFILAAYFAVAAGPIANTRYFLPVCLLVIGCGVIGLADMAERYTGKQTIK